MKKLYLSVCLAVLSVLQCFGQVPLLNSYPEAPAVIFLDFDGHHVSGTSWNWNGPFTCGPANLNDAQILEVFSRIAEDYRPFNINITTDSTRFLQAHYKRRTRVIFTVTNEWYGSSAGGVASNGSFARGDNTPCFVFTALHRYNVKNIAEAGSHEAGHTFGLRHQSVYNESCVKTNDYHWGEGSGETGWAPIMGVGYNRNFTVWHKGQNSLSCNTVQSDLDVITSSTNGIGFRPDDHADGVGAATPVTIEKKHFATNGLITQSADKDFFAFSLTAPAEIKLDARPYSVGSNNSGSNLDMRVSLLDASENLLAAYNPTPLLSSFADTVLGPGTYYVKVEGVGNQYASNYGSLGAYTLSGDIEEMTLLPLRKLLLEGSTSGGIHRLKWTIDADEAVVKQQLEVSVNGAPFTSFSEPGTQVRQWQQNAVPGTVQYRLKVQFDNGQTNFTNVVVLRNGVQVAGQPRLSGNVVKAGTQATLTSPVAFRYQLTDMNGRVLLSGNTQAGSLQLASGGLAAGVYLVRLSWNGGEKVDKLVINCNF